MLGSMCKQGATPRATRARLGMHGARPAWAPAALACALAALAVLATPGWAGASLYDGALTASRSVDRSCFSRDLAGRPGVATETIGAPGAGLLTAHLSAESGDWDLALFDSRTGDAIAASAYAGARELAQGFALSEGPVVVQACRRSGGDSTAEVRVYLRPINTQQSPPPVSMARVYTPTDESVARLQSLDLDVTESGGDGYVDVVLHGAADAAVLTRYGLAYRVLTQDLVAQDTRFRAQDRAYARSIATSGLPSGRTRYRRLFHYSEEMKDLAQRYPNLVRYFQLKDKTYEGRPVEGIEITSGVRRQDGKPVFLQMGLHHAREWPSGEHAMEWAYRLINGYRNDNPTIRGLVSRTRTIVVPVVNPDGFNTSREAGEAEGAGGGRGGDFPDPDTAETANILAHVYEYRRKNCRLVDDSPSGSCAQPSVGLAEPGVDPNRNYGGFWGGPGASTDPTAQDYRGPGPFSEPETRNIRRLISHHQVTTLITNHTFTGLVLRPPGIQSQGNPPDEQVYKRLGDAMAAENGYTSQHGYELYDTTGTTEDWSYYATGGLGFTFEIGPSHFHPPFADTVAEWEGTTPSAGPGQGNRQAYLIAQQSTANPNRHSVLTGQAPGGAKLTLRKRFITHTSKVIDADGNEGSVINLQDELKTVLTVPASGNFHWHINPSTRPAVAKQTGRAAHGHPSPPQRFSGDATTATPCANFDTTDPSCWNDHPFVVPAGAGIDNAKATVRIDWISPASDWDLKIFRDSNGDGSSQGETELVGSSASGVPENSEESTFVEPKLVPGRRYVARVQNFAAADPYEGTITFQGPDPLVRARVERWTLICESPTGSDLRRFVINRGERRHLDLRTACSS